MLRTFMTVLISYLFLVGCSDNSSSTSGSSGVGGSTARFTIQNGFLVVVENNLITSFSLSDPLNPEKKDVIRGTDGNLETIYPFDEDLIFIGSQTGSAIVRLYAESGENELGDYHESGDMEILAQVSHARSCDPVVANNTHMYVTIRDGNGCMFGDNSSNRLIVYDIRNLEYPIEVAERRVFRPFGLSLQGSRLYVCSEEGLKVFNIDEPSNPQVSSTYKSIQCNDVIALDDRLITTGDDRVIQIEGLPDNPEVSSVIARGQ